MCVVGACVCVCAAFKSHPQPPPPLPVQDAVFYHTRHLAGKEGRGGEGGLNVYDEGVMEEERYYGAWGGGGNTNTEGASERMGAAFKAGHFARVATRVVWCRH